VLVCHSHCDEMQHPRYVLAPVSTVSSFLRLPQVLNFETMSVARATLMECGRMLISEQTRVTALKLVKAQGMAIWTHYVQSQQTQRCVTQCCQTLSRPCFHCQASHGAAAPHQHASNHWISIHA
jgi:hypothetical protein